tara:strand:+ start:2295 stop:3773 length:1479 start_codon:yes stop_codon:yes gene_type:complete
MAEQDRFDVIVVGAGNAAMCAALAAREEGARVLVLEKAPAEVKGGNSAFSGGLFRFAHQGSEDVLSLVPDTTPAEVARMDMGPYTAETYSDDLIRLSEGRADPELVRVLVDESYDTMRWMQTRLGVRWELNRQSPRQEDRDTFLPGNELTAWGGGGGLMQQLFHAAEGQGVDVVCSASAVGFLTDDHGGVCGVRVKTGGEIQSLEAGAVVLGSGGFQASPEMRARYLGPGWDRMKVRGSRYNTGEVLDRAREIGAFTSGAWSRSDSAPADLDSPDAGVLTMGNLYSRNSSRLGIMVNTEGRRFTDEGADFHATGGVELGQAIWAQPDGVAYQIFDQQTAPMVEGPYAVGGRPVIADTWEELAHELSLDPETLRNTMTEFNAAVQDGVLNLNIKDGKGAVGLTPPRSNWARRLDQPPFVAYRVTTTILFTYGGLAVDPEARVLDGAYEPIPGLFATGEAIGGLYYRHFSTGSGLMLGSVFGRIAGANAARHAG